MESLRETKKRSSYEGGASPERRKSRRAEPLVDFLREKAAADREIRQQELPAKQQEQESQQQMMKATIPPAATNEHCIFDCCAQATR